MEDVENILIDNLRECLRLAQRYIVLSIGSALLLLVLIRGVPELLESGAKFDVPMLGEVDPDWAAFIFMVGFSVHLRFFVTTVALFYIKPWYGCCTTAE